MGFTADFLLKAKGREQILARIDLDGGDAAWTVIEPAVVFGRVRSEFEFARAAPWSQVYHEYFRGVSEDERFWATVEEGRKPGEYEFEELRLEDDWGS